MQEKISDEDIINALTDNMMLMIPKELRGEHDRAVRLMFEPHFREMVEKGELDAELRKFHELCVALGICDLAKADICINDNR